MNGRGYDYKLGRFLGVDPFIQDPGNSQAINGYSYIGNNPLSGTDPTGYAGERAGYSFSYQGLPTRVTTMQDVTEEKTVIFHNDGTITGTVKGNGATTSYALNDGKWTETGTEPAAVGAPGQVAQAQDVGGGDKGQRNGHPPIELLGSGEEQRHQYEALPDVDSQAFRAWFKENHSEIFAEQLLSAGDEIDDMEDAFHAYELAHGAYEMAKHGVWQAAKGGAGLYVAGKLVFMIPREILENQKREYRMATAGYHERVKNKYPDWGSGNYSNIRWELYNIDYNDRLSVDLYYYVSDQVDMRPPECSLDGSC